MAKKTTTRKAVKVLRKKPTTAPKKASKKQEATPIVEDTFLASSHLLVPKHQILTQEEVEALLVMYKVSPQNLPVIFEHDAAIKGLGAKMGDIIKITRKSPTAGTAIFYRRVAYE